MVIKPLFKKGMLSLRQGFPKVAQRKRMCLLLQETQVQSLGQKDPLQEEMATHSSIPAWKTP